MKVVSNIPTQLHLREDNEIPCTEKVNDIKNHRYAKPLGGFWTSTYNTEHEYYSDWINTYPTLFQSLHGTCWIMEPQDNCDIILIEDKQDLISVCKKYGFLDKDKNANSEYLLDFESIAADGWDGIWLTKNGEKSVGRIQLDDIHLSTWDSESILWFRWNFKNVKKHKTFENK